jgi:hypothetical protein
MRKMIHALKEARQKNFIKKMLLRFFLVIRKYMVFFSTSLEKTGNARIIAIKGIN